MEDTDMFTSIWASEVNLADPLQLDANMFAYQQEAPRSRGIATISKLRSSCDACGQAKTKCDRSRPTCSRCLSQGIKCVYGVSRKTGKPPRRPPPTASPRGPVTTGPNVDLIFSRAKSALAKNSDFPISDLGFEAQFPFDSLGELPTLGVLTPNSSDQDTAGWQYGTAEKSVESSSPPGATADATASRHSCAQESKDIMRVLYCANPSTPISDGVPARILDLGSVLTRSRDIVPRLELLMRCPCARAPHMAMLYASIMSRMLLWYRQAAWTGAAHTTDPPAQEPTPALSSRSVLEPSAAIDNGSGVSVLAMPVTVGTFQTDDRNLQTALTNCLLLSELRKVGGLIEMFASIGKLELRAMGDACPLGEEQQACQGDAPLFASLGSWLQIEHRTIFTKARSSLSVLHDSLPEPS
ncbi:hypothetical protein F5Y19DRAFT_22438 [Xylariaceae sp. FL1651]|nr:hypothetical protein F5Y19DRAFT_22438 [Xylariaceae sp. FL1651]